MAMEAKSSGVLTARPSSTSAVMSLNSLLNSSGSECLNECDDHPLDNCLQDNAALLKSDCDEQLIISLAFNQVVKIQSLKLRAPATSGPKTLRVFKNQPRTLDFSQAESFESIQVKKFSFTHTFNVLMMPACSCEVWGVSVLKLKANTLHWISLQSWQIILLINNRCRNMYRTST